MKQILILIFLVLLYIFFVYQHEIFILTTNIPKLLIWSYQLKDKKGFKKSRNLIEKTGMQGYFNSIQDNHIKKYFAPFYKHGYNIKKWDPNITDYKLYDKKNSISELINNFTTLTNIFGQWKADSLFRTSYEKRGEDNKLKEYYLYPLSKEYLPNYRNVIKNYLEDTITTGNHILLDLIHKITLDLLYLLHFGVKASEKDYEECIYFIDAVRHYYYGDIYNEHVIRQILNLKHFHRRHIDYIEELGIRENCIVGLWLKQGNLNKEQIFIEFIHNILGVSINWSNLTYTYLLKLTNNKVSRIPDKEESNDSNMERQKYIYECFRFICPATIIGSSLKDPSMWGLKKGKYQIVHDLKYITRLKEFFGEDAGKFNPQRFDKYHDNISTENTNNGESGNNGESANKGESGNNEGGKCPFYNSKKGAKVPCGLNVNEKKGYVPFGEGYRRCPGEFLSMIFMEEFADIIKYKDFTISLKDNKSVRYRYIWDFIEGNYEITIRN